MRQNAPGQSVAPHPLDVSQRLRLRQLLALHERELYRRLGELESRNVVVLRAKSVPSRRITRAEVVGHTRFLEIFQDLSASTQASDYERVFRVRGDFGELERAAFIVGALRNITSAKSALVFTALALRLNRVARWRFRSIRDRGDFRPADLRFSSRQRLMLWYMDEMVGSLPQPGFAPMKYDLTVRREDDGLYVTAPRIAGLRMWHRDRREIAKRLPARAKRLLRSNHGIDAEVTIDRPGGISAGEALLKSDPKLVVTRNTR